MVLVRDNGRIIVLGSDKKPVHKWYLYEEVLTTIYLL